MKDRKIHGERMCGVQLKDTKRGKDLMLIFDFNDTIDQLAIANSVH